MWEFKNWRDIKSVRRGVNRIFEAVGEWFVLIKVDKRFICMDCEDEEICQSCFGSGYKTTVYYSPGRLSGVPRNTVVDGLDTPGYVPTRERALHMPIVSNLEEGDLVLQCEWNVRGTAIKTNQAARPVKVVAAFKVLEKYVPYQTQTSWIKGLVESMDMLLPLYNDHIRDLYPGNKILIND